MAAICLGLNVLSVKKLLPNGIIKGHHFTPVFTVHVVTKGHDDLYFSPSQNPLNNPILIINVWHKTPVRSLK